MLNYYARLLYRYRCMICDTQSFNIQITLIVNQSQYRSLQAELIVQTAYTIQLNTSNNDFITNYSDVTNNLCMVSTVFNTK